MKKLALLIAFTFMLGLLPIVSLAETADPLPDAETAGWTGTGAESDPYVITTASGLTALANYVNTKIENNCSGVYFALGADIDLNTTEKANIIGHDATNGDVREFSGHFDGRGHAVYGFRYLTGKTGTAEIEKRLGVFGTTNGATIKNLVVGEVGNTTNTTIKAAEKVGGVVGHAQNSIIEDCVNYAVISSSDAAKFGVFGGIVGELTGDASVVRNCKNYGNISAGKLGIGGIVGKMNDGLVSSCENYGEINAAEGIAGGIVGTAVSGSIENCQNHGFIVCTSGKNTNSALNFHIGGIAGETIESTETPVIISNCINYGAFGGGVSGGIIGSGVGGPIISDCVNYGDFRNLSDTDNMYSSSGGIAGRLLGKSTNYALIERCYNVGDIIAITGRNTGKVSETNYLAGIVARVDQTKAYITVKESFNMGSVSSNGGDSGGIIGTCSKVAYLTLTDCYDISMEDGDYSNAGTITPVLESGTPHTRGALVGNIEYPGNDEDTDNNNLNMRTTMKINNSYAIGTSIFAVQSSKAACNWSNIYWDITKAVSQKTMNDNKTSLDGSASRIGSRTADEFAGIKIAPQSTTVTDDLNDPENRGDSKKPWRQGLLFPILDWFPQDPGVKSVLIDGPSDLAADSSHIYTAQVTDFYDAQAQATMFWSLKSPVEGIAVDSATGEVTVDSSVATGTEFTLQATTSTAPNHVYASEVITVSELVEPTTGIEISAIENEADTKVSFTVTLSNEDAAAIGNGYMVVVALYDAKGDLVSAGVEKITSYNNMESGTITFVGSSDDSYTAIKAMLWEPTEVAPLCTTDFRP